MRLFDPEDQGTGPSEPGTDPAPPAVPAEHRAAPLGPLCRVRLLIAYDGSAFHGFAHQPGQVTVAGRLAEAIGHIAGHEVSLTCAGRTDSGVHATGQVVHADVAPAFLTAYPEPSRLIRSLTHQVAPDIAVLDLQPAAEGFDARRSALSRRYRYLILRGEAPDPLLRHTSWHVTNALDVPAMRLAADTVLGTHDFAAFCRRRPDGGSLERHVSHVGLSSGTDPRLLRFEIEANAFCHQMVRSIVGALVSVGEGKLTAADVLEILRSGDRARGSRLAPPGGLCLESVRYPPELVEGGVWLPPGEVAVA